jgi:hypothetical protein
MTKDDVVQCTECEKYCLVKIKAGLTTDDILVAGRGFFTEEHILRSIISLEDRKIIYPLSSMRIGKVLMEKNDR